MRDMALAPIVMGQAPQMSISNSSTCSPVVNVPSADLVLDIVTNVTTTITCLPQIIVLCRARSSEGVSLATCTMTVGMLWMQLAAAILTKWKQITACGDIGLVRCAPGLLDELQLVLLQASNMIILLQVVALPPTSSRRKMLAVAVIVGTFCTWGACVALSLALPCGSEVAALANAFGVCALMAAFVQYLPQIAITCRHRGSGSLSVTYYALQVCGGCVVFAEQLGAHDRADVWGPMLASTTLQGCVLVLAMAFDTRSWLSRRRQVVQSQRAEPLLANAESSAQPPQG